MGNNHCSGECSPRPPRELGNMTGKDDMISFLHWNYQMNFSYSQNGPYPKRGSFHTRL